jgi:hypothetical protein
VPQGRNLGDAEALSAGLLSATLNDHPVLIEAVTVPHCEWQIRLPPGCGGRDANVLAVSVGGVISAPLPLSYAKPAVFSIRRCEEAAAAIETQAEFSPRPAVAIAPPSAAVSRDVVLYISGINFGECEWDAELGDAEAGAGDALVAVLVCSVSCPAARVVVDHCKIRVPLPPAAVAALGKNAPAPSDVEVIVAGVSSK